MDTPIENSRQALPIRLPIRLFETQKRMNDYKAEDMKFGDLTQFFLQEYYQPNNISKNINPFTHPNRDESARILFDEQLWEGFAFKPFITEMNVTKTIEGGRNDKDQMDFNDVNHTLRRYILEFTASYSSC